MRAIFPPAAAANLAPACPANPSLIEKNFRKPLFIAYYSDICSSEKYVHLQITIFML